MQRDGRPIRLDETAQSADPALPAFLARPAGAPVYHGFPVVPETLTDGWVYGAITDYLDPDGADGGDGYVIAPDGRRAGLVWAADEGAFAEISPPDQGRWGVYAVWFPKPVRTLEDLIECFRHVLPDLQRVHARLFGSGEA
jgi:hypothetical protein